MRRLLIPSFHVHLAICVGDDEDVDVATLLRGWRGRILAWLGFTVAARWLLLHREPTDGPNEVHIVPVNDGMGHEIRATCVCGPYMLRELHGPEPDTLLITHQALDVREIAPTEAELTP